MLLDIIATEIAWLFNCIYVFTSFQELENCKTLDYIPPKFKILTFDELMKNSKPFETEDENFWEAFISKSEKKL